MPALGTPYVEDVVPTAIGNTVSNVSVAAAETANGVDNYTPTKDLVAMSGPVTVQLHEGVPIKKDARINALFGL